MMEIPFGKSEIRRSQWSSFVFFTCGGLWGLLIVNLFMPPLNNYDLTPFPVRGIYRKTRYNM